MDVLAWIMLVVALFEIPFGGKPNHPYPWRLVVTEIVETENEGSLSVPRVLQFHSTEAECLKALTTVAPELNPRCERNS